MMHIESPSNEDSSIEREIKARGLTAPRITPEDIKANIVSEHYFTAADGVEFNLDRPLGRPGKLSPSAQRALGLLTFCVLVLRNGFTVTGESACASPENFDADIGRRIARENAVQKMWPLMGYELKCRLANTPPDAPPVNIEGKPYEPGAIENMEAGLS